MRIITHEDIVNLKITPIQCYEWAKKMIQNKNRTVLKPKISMKFGDTGFYNTMPAILPDEHVVGVKVVSRYAMRTPSLDSQLLLYDLETGKLKALMDANYITTMRTGAVAAYSIQLLAKKDFCEIGFIGLGNTARATFKILMSVFPDCYFRVKLKKYKNQQNDFIQTFQNHMDHVDFLVSDTYDDVVTGSDVIISSVTYSGENFCPDACYTEGCLVVPIHTRGFQNCDLFFDKIYADDRAHVEGFQYFDKFKDFAELTDVVTGVHSGRSSSHERILIYNIGIAIHDIYFAEQIYRITDQNNSSQDLQLNSLQNKFWVQSE